MPQDRRRFFRVNHPLKLRLQPQPEIPHASQDPLSQLNTTISEQLTLLQPQLPEVAKLLQLLNQKINLFTPPPLWQLDDANLSACGLAFTHPSQAEKGSLLALELHLGDTSPPILLQGRLLECQAEHQNFHWRINFEDIPSSLQDQLIQHLLKRQRQERNTPPATPV